MYLRSSLLCAFVAAATAVFAAPEPEKVEARNFPGGAFPNEFNPAIVSLIPTSVWANPSAASSAYSAIQAGNPPSWYTSLPSDAKSYLSGWGNNWSGGSWPTDWSSSGSWPTDWSSGSWPTGWSSGSWDSSSGSWDSASWSSSAWATSQATTTAQANSTAIKTSPSAPFVTANTAARPTALIGASFAGVVGVLGAALML